MVLFSYWDSGQRYENSSCFYYQLDIIFYKSNSTFPLVYSERLFVLFILNFACLKILRDALLL